MLGCARSTQVIELVHGSSRSTPTGVRILKRDRVQNITEVT
jgi:hypothetical protein